MELSVPQLKGLIDILSELNTDKLLQKSVEKFSWLIRAKGCSIFIFDENTNTIHLAATTGEQGEDLSDVLYEEGEGLTGWVFKHREPLLIQNMDKKSIADLREQYGPDMNPVSKFVEGGTAQAISFMAVPLIAKNGRFYGVFRTSSLEENFYREDLELLHHLASYLSEALANSAMYLNERVKADYFSLLTQFGTQLHSYIGLDELLSFVSEQAARTFAAETCEIYMRDEQDKNRLVLRAGWGVPPELINVAEHTVGEGLTGALVDENRIIRLANVLNYPRYKGKYRPQMLKNLKHGQRLAFLGSPISIKDRPVGAIKLYNKINPYPGGPACFTEDDEKYLGVLADMLSVAIENHLYLVSMQNSAIQIVKTQRLTALGTMAIRLPNEITNSLTTAQLHTHNLIARLEKNRVVDVDFFKSKLYIMRDQLQEVLNGVRTLQEYSTRAGFVKTRRNWGEMVDESLLFLHQELLHKKINLQREKESEAAIPLLLVEPNEITEVIIDLLIIAISALKHYQSDLYLQCRYFEQEKRLHTYLRSQDNPDGQPFPQPDSGDDAEIDVVTPHAFMLSVARAIIAANYGGRIDVMPHNLGLYVEMVIPVDDKTL